MGEASGLFSLNNRRILLVAVFIVVFSLLFFSIRSCGARDPYSDYVVIYSNLDLRDAANVVSFLKGAKIPYQIKEGGRSLAVPRDRADEAKLSLAEKNLPAGGSVGWEIFDESKLGTTDFDRRVQFARAISGELARTIIRIEAIDDARVQIVIPQTQLFEVTKVPVTASVLLQLKPGRSLTREQVNGIVRLVASSVENLRPENVTIIDVFGNMLTNVENGSLQTLPAVATPEPGLGEGAAPGRIPPAVKDAESPSAEMPEPTVVTKPQETMPEDQSPERSVEPRIVEPVPVRNEASAPKEVPVTMPVAQEISGEEKLLEKLKSKEEYENRLSSKAQMLVNRFYPPNSILVKVNVEFVDANKYVKKPQAKQPNKKTVKPGKVKASPKAAAAKQGGNIRKLTVIVLVDNRFNMTQALKKTTFITIKNALPYDSKRGDRIILRQVPFHYATAMGTATTPSGIPVEKVSGLSPLKTIMEYGRMAVYGIAGFIVILLIIWIRRFFSRREETPYYEPPARPAEPRAEDRSAAAVEQMRSAVSQSPEKVAELLKKWLNEEDK